MVKAIILLAAITTFALPAFSQPATRTWEFRVYLDEKPIGFHHFRLTESGDVLQVSSEARFDVKVLMLNLYRYRHSNRETWENNCLTSISAETDANGRNYRVQGTRANGGFELDQAGSSTLPPCVMTFAYWNPAFLGEQKLLNAQTGQYEPVTVKRLDREYLPYGGRQVPSLRYQVVTASGPITLWYHADDSRWLGLESPLKGGKTLRYEPVAIPGQPVELARR